MILFPLDYSKENPDDELKVVNYGQRKKVKELPDVGYARGLALVLQKELSLSLDVCHSLGEDIAGIYFVFSEGENWVDPGPEIESLSDLQLPLCQLLN
jgi:hypothetical protein